MTWTRYLFALLLVLGEPGEQRELTAQSEECVCNRAFSYVHDTLSAFEATGRLSPIQESTVLDIEAFVVLSKAIECSLQRLKESHA